MVAGSTRLERKKRGNRLSVGNLLEAVLDEEDHQGRENDMVETAPRGTPQGYQRKR